MIECAILEGFLPCFNSKWKKRLGRVCTVREFQKVRKCLVSEGIHKASIEKQLFLDIFLLKINSTSRKNQTSLILGKHVTLTKIQLSPYRL